ncbi:hypothetical protein FM106_03680 [Brachybacterium faecium]|nr:hypothetical protein FM106_03680 [Brachybacterium faecium]
MTAPFHPDIFIKKSSKPCWAYYFLINIDVRFKNLRKIFLPIY